MRHTPVDGKHRQVSPRAQLPARQRDLRQGTPGVGDTTVWLHAGSAAIRERSGAPATSDRSRPN